MRDRVSPLLRNLDLLDFKVYMRNIYPPFPKYFLCPSPTPSMRVCKYVLIQK